VPADALLDVPLARGLVAPRGQLLAADGTLVLLGDLAARRRLRRGGLLPAERAVRGHGVAVRRVGGQPEGRR
jgi:hypothetical protein